MVNLTPTVLLLDATVQVLTSVMQAGTVKKSDKVIGWEAYADPYTYGIVMTFDAPLAGAVTDLTSPLHSFWMKVPTLETTLMAYPDP